MSYACRWARAGSTSTQVGDRDIPKGPAPAGVRQTLNAGAPPVPGLVNPRTGGPEVGRQLALLRLLGLIEGDLFDHCKVDTQLRETACASELNAWCRGGLVRTACWVLCC